MSTQLPHGPTFLHPFVNAGGGPAFSYIYITGQELWRPFNEGDRSSVSLSGVTVDNSALESKTDLTNALLQNVSGNSQTTADALVPLFQQLFNSGVNIYSIENDVFDHADQSISVVFHNSESIASGDVLRTYVTNQTSTSVDGSNIAVTGGKLEINNSAPIFITGDVQSSLVGNYVSGDLLRVFNLNESAGGGGVSGPSSGFNATGESLTQNPVPIGALAFQPANIPVGQNGAMSSLYINPDNGGLYTNQGVSEYEHDTVSIVQSGRFDKGSYLIAENDSVVAGNWQSLQVLNDTTIRTLSGPLVSGSAWTNRFLYAGTVLDIGITSISQSGGLILLYN